MPYINFFLINAVILCDIFQNIYNHFIINCQVISVTVLAILNFYMGAKLPGWMSETHHCKVFTLFSSFPCECFSPL